MIVLGIDPGIANVGFGALSSKSTVIVSGTLITDPRRPTEHRIYSIARRIKYLIEATEADLVVIEEFIPFRQRKNMSAIDKACGAIIYIAKDSGARVILVRPNVWMRKVLGLSKTAHFSKLYLQKKVDRHLGVRTRVEHEAEALGLALYGKGEQLR